MASYFTEVHLFGSSAGSVNCLPCSNVIQWLMSLVRVKWIVGPMNFALFVVTDFDSIKWLLEADASYCVARLMDCDSPCVVIMKRSQVRIRQRHVELSPVIDRRYRRA